MELVLFYEMMLMMLVTCLAAAICLSAYLVNRNRIMLFASCGFVFYFFDMVLVFQDSYLDTVDQAFSQSGAYLLLRSLLVVVTGGGAITCLWLAACDYVNENRLGMQTVPCLAFVIASLGILLGFPEGDGQRFAFYTLRTVYLFFIVGFMAVRCLTTKDSFERERLKKNRWFAAALVVLGCCVVGEDAIAFLVAPDALLLGSYAIDAERNYSENLLALVCALTSCFYAARLLTLRFQEPTPLEQDLGSKGVQEGLKAYGHKHGLSGREQEVLGQILLGKDNQNIASEMCISLNTVKVHVHNICKKTGCTNRTDLMQDFWRSR